MATILQQLAIALQHHQSGRLQAAEEIYRQILEVDPDHAEALHRLRAINAGTDNRQNAVANLHLALTGNADEAKAQADLGNILRQQGNLAEAVACYRRALELNPEDAEIHNNLGIALKHQGQLAEAVACYRRALQLRPEYAGIHYNLGIALQKQGDPQAIECYRRALQLHPGHYNAYNNLGTMLHSQGNLDEALACYRRSLELRPDSAVTQNNLGITLKDRGEIGEAVACYRRALELKPDFADAQLNLGAALQEQGNWDEAVACYRRALELKPDFADAKFNLGAALQEQGNWDEAVACYRWALEQKPDDPTTLCALVHALQYLCCWEDVEAISQRVIAAVARDTDGAMAFSLSPFNFLVLPTPTTAEQQRRCAELWVDRQWKAPPAPERGLTRKRASQRKSKITIGYLSADFHSHATAWLIAELFEKHDRERFEIFGYSYGPDDGSPMRRRLVKAFDRFADLKDASFVEAAQRIAGDGVDILIDLKGYTQNARTPILTLRPAPVQVNYLGYPGTMGAAFMDYILVDDFIVPPDQQPFFTERLVHLPGCYQVNDSQREIAAQTPARAECGLPEAGFVFCSFNNSYKITPAVFAVWMRLLQAVPGSTLWLLEANRWVSDNLRREAAARGVSAERLVFAPRLALPEHLARHRLADLFVDSFPVNAHTTASDALWAACPVLTLAGRTFVSRVAGSLLRALDLPELITTSLADYEAMALRLARDANYLAGLRTRLAANRKTSRLFDAGHFARNVEKAYVTMRAIHASGEKPRSFVVGPT